MKHALLAIAIALALANCGSDGPASPLSEAEYTAQGNAICEQLTVRLDAIENEALPDLTDDELLELSVQAGTVSRDAIDELFALAPPSSKVTDRQILLDLTNERIELIGRLQGGEDVGADIQLSNEQFETQAIGIWPSCERP